MLNFKHLFLIFSLTLSSFGVFSLKYHVRELQEEINHLQAQISLEEDLLNSLQAEWAYLNKPERLRQLTEKYLDMQPLDRSQIYQNIPEVNVAKSQHLPEKPVIVASRTKISESLLSKVSLSTKQKIKWDEKRHRFIKINCKNETDS